ncbi:EI24 domain-containing protein [Qipengyuania sp. 6B39]|uniref:EI24 domain-containing protein n=1 Tax=Qipengyuania proteolytica TaxID=2867239 RepID=UPI001C899422|nr:EI24 domain-containing protein [Qipengyuania proteolytica]MBX7494683.1 EI24 domain-containing protein [Qipengyuania proteolytica]
MVSLPRALSLAIGQLGDPAILRVLAKSLALTLAIFVVGGGAVLAALYNWLLSLDIAFSAELSALAAVLFTVIAGWLLFRIVALAVLQFFADDVVRAVEARHYPAHAANARLLPFREELANSLRATGRVILLNLVALPVALVLLFTAIGPAIVFWAVNAVLLGRELQDMVWLRHRQGAQQTAPIGAGTRFALGGIVAAMLAIPFLNLLAPIIGAASATHLVHRAAREPVVNA